MTEPAGKERAGNVIQDPERRTKQPGDDTRDPESRCLPHHADSFLQFLKDHGYLTRGMATISRTWRSKKLAV